MSTRTRTWEAAVVAFVLLISSAGVCLHAEEWTPFEGAEQLRDLVAGATAEIELKPGHVAVGQYRADGTATINAWGETFERTWEVRGDDQVCYSSERETNCFTFETNVDTPGEYRARHVETGEIRIFRVTEADPDVVTADTAPGGEGGLGAPSASEVAAALSNPNTSMGTMNTLFDFVTYDGDLQDAGSQLVANWVLGDLAGALNKDGLNIGDSRVSADEFAGLISRIHDDTISGKIAKQVFEAMWSGEGTADEVIEAKGLKQITDASAIEAVVDKVIAANPGQVAEYKAGKDKLIGFFVGQVMKETKGQANPGQVNQVLKAKLSG